MKWLVEVRPDEFQTVTGTLSIANGVLEFYDVAGRLTVAYGRRAWLTVTLEES